MDKETIYDIVDKAKKYEQLTFLQKTKVLCCSFCGKSQNETQNLFAGQNVYICDECVGLCVEMLEEMKSGIKKIND